VLKCSQQALQGAAQQSPAHCMVRPQPTLSGNLEGTLHPDSRPHPAPRTQLLRKYGVTCYTNECRQLPRWRCGEAGLREAPHIQKMLTLHNHKTATQTHSLCGVVLFDADAQLEKVAASTPRGVAWMVHMLHHCRGGVLGSPRFAAPPHNCQGSQAIFGQLPVTFPCLSPQPPPPQRVTACS
jgi:hypothetical protein